MISLSWDSNFEPNSYDANRHIRKLMKAFKGLPRHIAKKHLKAAMKKIVKPGVPILRSLTPPLTTRRGRRKKGEKPRSTGNLRRSVTAKSGQTGNNDQFGSFIWGVLGYRYSGQDRKAIWLEFGTSGGVRPYRMAETAFQRLGPRSAKELAKYMADGLENAAKEIAAGKNPGWGN